MKHIPPMQDSLPFDDHPNTTQDCPSTRAAGLARLTEFAPYSGRAYAQKRNYDWGPHNRRNVSGLSPYVRHRLVLEEECVQAALRHHTAQEAEKFIQEVFWRTYWKGWLEHRPDVWNHYRNSLTAALRDLEKDRALRRRYEEACAGRTGIACFDAWAQELMDTNYVHNHARMWFASIWIFTLRLPWVLGADFFLRHLLDGDAASNTLSWRWVAGLHTKGKYYVARAENIETYTSGRFVHPEGLALNPEPLSESIIFERTPLAHVPLNPPEGETALLITEEDLCPETLGLHTRHIIAAAGIQHAAHRSVLETAPAVQAFAAQALEDSFTRWVDATGQEAPRRVENIDSLLDWARALPVKHITYAELPVGSTRDALTPALAVLADEGFRLHAIRRPWDARIWPHATKGFFALKKKIADSLSSLGIDTGLPDRGDHP